MDFFKAQELANNARLYTTLVHYACPPKNVGRCYAQMYNTLSWMHQPVVFVYRMYYPLLDNPLINLDYHRLLF